MTLNDLYTLSTNAKCVESDAFSMLLQTFYFQTYQFAGGRKKSVLITSYRKTNPVYAHIYNTMYKLLQFIYNYDEYCSEFYGKNYSYPGNLFKRLSCDDFRVVMRVQEVVDNKYEVAVISYFHDIDKAPVYLSPANYVQFFIEELKTFFIACSGRSLTQAEYGTLYNAFNLYIDELQNRGKLKQYKKPTT